jgi:hypothetical protein
VVREAGEVVTVKKPVPSRYEATLRKHALSFPETHEEFPWGHRAVAPKKLVASLS